MKKTTTIRSGRHEVTISNPDKIFWPKEGYTKLDVVRYYEAVAPYILPHLKGRPLSLKRNPDGIEGSFFYHKDAGENPPPYASVCKVDSQSRNNVIDYLVCNNAAMLLHLANLGCIEMNPWNSTCKKLLYPTWMVIDIDPSPKNTFIQVIDTALAAKEVLDRLGIPAYCKTSGATGLHVYVPLHNRYSYEVVKGFGEFVAFHTQQQVPEFTTLERPLNKRKGRIYIDFLQNNKAQTLASAYSIRPVPGATVSTPLEWKEVNHRLSPQQFTFKNITQRLKRKGDLFAPVLTEKVSLEKLIRQLETATA